MCNFLLRAPGRIPGWILFSFSPDAREDPEAFRPMIQHALHQYYDNRPGRDRNRPEASGL